MKRNFVTKNEMEMEIILRMPNVSNLGFEVEINRYKTVQVDFRILQDSRIEMVLITEPTMDLVQLIYTGPPQAPRPHFAATHHPGQPGQLHHNNLTY